MNATSSPAPTSLASSTGEPPVSLAPGRFFGAVAGRWQSGMVTLSVVEHATARAVPVHSHAHMYLSLLLRGGYCEWVGDQRLDYHPLTAVFHPEDLVHRDEITAAGSAFFIVEIDPALLGPRERRHRGLASVRELAGGPTVWALLRLLSALGGARRDALDGEEPVAEILDRLLGSPPVRGAPPRWLRRVEDELAAAYREPVSLHALADVAGVHPTHAARVFRHHHGCTMRDRLHRLRVLEACRRIGGGAGLAEAAADTGFCDQAHLTHVFHAVTGMTPARYRALVRGRATGQGKRST